MKVLLFLIAIAVCMQTEKLRLKKTNAALRQALASFQNSAESAVAKTVMKRPESKVGKDYFLGCNDNYPTMTSCNIWNCPASMGPTKCDWAPLGAQLMDMQGKYCYCADGYMTKTTADDQTWTQTCVPCQKDEEVELGTIQQQAAKDDEERAARLELNAKACTTPKCKEKLEQAALEYKQAAEYWKKVTTEQQAAKEDEDRGDTSDATIQQQAAKEDTERAERLERKAKEADLKPDKKLEQAIGDGGVAVGVDKHCAELKAKYPECVDGYEGSTPCKPSQEDVNYLSSNCPVGDDSDDTDEPDNSDGSYSDETAALDSESIDYDTDSDASKEDSDADITMDLLSERNFSFSHNAIILMAAIGFIATLQHMYNQCNIRSKYLGISFDEEAA